MINALIKELTTNLKAQDKVLSVIASEKGLQCRLVIDDSNKHYNLLFNTGDSFKVPLDQQSLALLVPEIANFIIEYQTESK